MQEHKTSGKLENIKSIREILPALEALRAQTRETRAQLDSAMTDLRERRTELAAQRDEAIRREAKEKEFEGLRRQREEEKKIAERIVDQKAEALKNKQNQELNRYSNHVQDNSQSHTVSQQETIQARTQADKPQRQETFNKPLEQAAKPQQQQFTRPGSSQFAGRPQFNRPQNSNYPNAANSGSRTWTPSQSTARPNTFGQRPFGDRNFGARPFGDRPFTPRPGGFAPRQPGQFGNRPFPGPRPGAPRPAGSFGAAKPTERFVPKADTSSNKKKGRAGVGPRPEEKATMDKRSLLRRGIIEEQEIEERMLTRIFKTKKAKENSVKQPKAANSAIIINTNNLTVKTLSEKIGKSAAEIIKQLMVLGNMCTINSTIDFGTAELVAMEFGLKLELQAEKTFEEKMGERHKKGSADDADLETRPPVVTVMGHVDHGKTSLLDAIRKTNTVSRESGGITQHIGAYQVTVPHGKISRKITFIDTPGHAAFDKMRARGAKITDIAILIVAADDGVMPQTVEAIRHIQNQELPMIVAINKMDKREAKPDRVIEQLAEHNVVTEAWGGNTIVVQISAATGQGIDKLLDMILLTADMYGYKANPNKEAQGSIIDARLDKNRGPLVTVLVQSGTLKVGDTLLAGTTYGKVRGLTDENGKAVKKALPSMPVVVLGFSEVPKAGDSVYVVDEKLTKQVVSERKDKEKIKRAGTKIDVAGIDALARLESAAKKSLNIIVKGDVAGSVEAIIQSINNITSDEVNVNVINSGVGAVNDNDIALAEMSDALLIAFHTNVSQAVKAKADKAKIKIHEFKVIYEIFDFITEKMVRMFAPKFITTYLGKAEIRALFKSSAVGIIAGCMVLDGKVARGNKVKLIRAKDELGTNKIESLKIKTNDVKEVGAGFECGIKLENTAELKVGDILEAVGTEQVPIVFNGKKYEF